MAKLFKKQGFKQTIVNVGLGGVANVAFDYAWSALGTTVSSIDEYKNIIKVAGGAILGTMTKNNYLHAATDGIAVVGASNLIAGLIDGSASNKEGSAGLPYGTIGAVRQGSPYFAGKKKNDGFSIAGAFDSIGI